MIITCTAISDQCKYHVFGRTLDLEYSLDESVVITPRRYPLDLLHLEVTEPRYAIVGAAHLAGKTPLYYDAVNECGLCAAALSFPLFAEYDTPKVGAQNVASFELIPWVLSRADSTDKARQLLTNINITGESFSDKLPATPLHWIFADAEHSVTVESTRQGIKIQENPVGVLTNSPDFEAQTINLERYAHIINNDRRIPDLHSRGLDGFGIPGDFSSGSRFVRAVYLKRRPAPPKTREEAVTRYLHIMESVSQPVGATCSEDTRPVRTVYTSAIDTERREYFFTTYENRRVRRVKLEAPYTVGSELSVYPMLASEDIEELN